VILSLSNEVRAAALHPENFHNGKVAVTSMKIREACSGSAPVTPDILISINAFCMPSDVFVEVTYGISLLRYAKWESCSKFRGLPWFLLAGVLLFRLNF
jgi:hypothetical protein